MKFRFMENTHINTHTHTHQLIVQKMGQIIDVNSVCQPSHPYSSLFTENSTPSKNSTFCGIQLSLSLSLLMNILESGISYYLKVVTFFVHKIFCNF